MIALATWETLALLAGALLPGLLLALVGLLLFFAGLGLGRRWPAGSVRRLVQALRDLASGRPVRALEDLPPGPAAEVGEEIQRLAAALGERERGGGGHSARLAEALDAFGDRGLLVVDRELRVLAAGEGFARLVGGRPGDFVGHPVAGVFTTESWQTLAAWLTAPEGLTEGGRMNAALRRAAGEPRAVRVAGVVLPGARGEIALLVEVAGDEQESGARLERRLEEARALTDAVAEAIVVVRDGVVVALSSGAERWLGSAVLGERLERLLAAEDLLLALDRVGRAQGGESVEPFHCWVVPPAPQDPRRVEARAVPCHHDGGPAVALALRAAAARLPRPRRSRDNEARLLALLETLTDGFVLLTPAPGDGWQVSLVNPHTTRLLGGSPALDPGMNEEDLARVLEGCLGTPAGSLREFLAAPPAAAAEPRTRVVEPAGAPPRSIELSLRAVRTAEGRLIGKVLVLRDVTAQRRRERRLAGSAEQLEHSRRTLQKAYEDLAAANRNLEQRSGELARMNKELVELDRTRAQLLANISHELQTPLVSIRGYTQMVLEGRLGKINEEQRRGLEVAVRNVDRMVEMISALLAYARSEKAEPADPEPTDPRPVLAEVLDRHRENAAAHEITIEARPVPEGLWLMAEQEALLQVLDNLVANAIKYNRRGGKVEVGFSAEEGPWVELAVRDTGLGIAADEVGKVFDRFYRARNATGISGTGTGLATVRNLVEQHGGRIEEKLCGFGGRLQVLTGRARKVRCSPP
ncbi:MAG: PAS domain-containing sensor histidine kinase [Acidobacteriota bacterium]|nr:PAS domain-containing sensor histidine kinase [Acidobacteriota bacterium]